MPSPATLLASFSPRNVLDSRGRLQTSERLTDALVKYQSDADIESLRRAYDCHQEHQENLKKPSSFVESILRGILSFNIAPSNAYDRYMAIVKHRKNTEAIDACWKSVGDHLSFALINGVFEEKK